MLQRGGGGGGGGERSLPLSYGRYKAVSILVPLIVAVVIVAACRDTSAKCCQASCCIPSRRQRRAIDGLNSSTAQFLAVKLQSVVARLGIG